MPTIHVTLADCPTDVLVALVDEGGWVTPARLATVGPDDLSDAELLSKIRRALALLDTMGLVEINRHRVAGLAARATEAGRSAVVEARRHHGPRWSR